MLNRFVLTIPYECSRACGLAVEPRVFVDLLCGGFDPNIHHQSILLQLSESDKHHHGHPAKQERRLQHARVLVGPTHVQSLLFEILGK